jgi:hypothetical protein
MASNKTDQHTHAPTKLARDKSDAHDKLETNVTSNRSMLSTPMPLYPNPQAFKFSGQNSQETTKNIDMEKRQQRMLSFTKISLSKT